MFSTSSLTLNFVGALQDKAFVTVAFHSCIIDNQIIVAYLTQGYNDFISFIDM